MDNTISLTVPADDLDALDAARGFFTQLLEARAASPAGSGLPDYSVGRAVDAGEPDPSEAFADNGPSKNYDPDSELPDGGAHVEQVHAPEPQPEAPAPEPGIETDADGLPWDHRIHSSSKKKNQGDGRWKKRKNVDPDERAAVEAELRQLMAAPTPEPQAEAPAPTPTPEAPAPEAPAPTPEAPAPTPQPEAPAPAATTVTDFPGFLKAVGENVAAQRITWDRVNEICARHGAAQSALLASRVDLIPAVWADVQRELGAAHG